MIQALNYTPKAIAEFRRFTATALPRSAAGFRFIADKLAAAQVFVLPDSGELLDRSKARPEVPGLIFRPPFPVVALEYEANAHRPDILPSEPCTKRIALAWEWSLDELPRALRYPGHEKLGPGVVVASICFYDRRQHWIPIMGMGHIGYEDGWEQPTGSKAAIRNLLLDRKILAPANARGTSYPMTLIPLLPEVLEQHCMVAGSEVTLLAAQTDLMDEVNAYTDLCYALGCGNVSTRLHLAPEKLNKARERSGKPPLLDYHVLELATYQPGETVGLTGGTGSARPHLRRGHIRHLRHLGPNRITWVNASMVRGRGSFADKAYAVRAQA